MDPLIPRSAADNFKWIHVHLAFTGSWLCAVRWEGDAHQCLAELEAPILQAFLSVEMEQPLVLINLCGKQECNRCSRAGFPRRSKSCCSFLDHQNHRLRKRAPIGAHWEAISKGIWIILQEAPFAASAVADVSADTRLWLHDNKDVALGADGYWIRDGDMVVPVTRSMYDLGRFNAFKIDYWRSIKSHGDGENWHCHGTGPSEDEYFIDTDLISAEEGSLFIKRVRAIQGAWRRHQACEVIFSSEGGFGYLAAVPKDQVVGRFARR